MISGGKVVPQEDDLPVADAEDLHGYQHPLLHLKRLGPAGIFETYARQFEAIWAESRPIPGMPAVSFPS